MVIVLRVASALEWAGACRDSSSWEARMAAARDQAARVLRPDLERDQGDAAADASALAEQLRSQVADEAKRKPLETPSPATDKPAVPSTSVAPGEKSGKRKLVPMGIGALLALAVAGYGAYYFIAGRFYISTDDAYVRANNTMLGARVSAHIAAILPADNAL